MLLIGSMVAEVQCDRGSADHCLVCGRAAQKDPREEMREQRRAMEKALQEVRPLQAHLLFSLCSHSGGGSKACMSRCRHPRQRNGGPATEQHETILPNLLHSVLDRC